MRRQRPTPLVLKHSSIPATLTSANSISAGLEGEQEQLDTPRIRRPASDSISLLQNSAEPATQPSNHTRWGLLSGIPHGRSCPHSLECTCSDKGSLLRPDTMPGLVKSDPAKSPRLLDIPAVTPVFVPYGDELCDGNAPRSGEWISEYGLSLKRNGESTLSRKETVMHKIDNCLAVLEQAMHESLESAFPEGESNLALEHPFWDKVKATSPAPPNRSEEAGGFSTNRIPTLGRADDHGDHTARSGTRASSSMASENPLRTQANLPTQLQPVQEEDEERPISCYSIESVDVVVAARRECISSSTPKLISPKSPGHKTEGCQCPEGLDQKSTIWTQSASSEYQGAAGGCLSPTFHEERQLSNHDSGYMSCSDTTVDPAAFRRHKPEDNRTHNDTIEQNIASRAENQQSYQDLKAVRTGIEGKSGARKVKKDGEEDVEVDSRLPTWLRKERRTPTGLKKIKKLDKFFGEIVPVNELFHQAPLPLPDPVSDSCSECMSFADSEHEVTNHQHTSPVTNLRYTEARRSHMDVRHAGEPKSGLAAAATRSESHLHLPPVAQDAPRLRRLSVGEAMASVDELRKRAFGLRGESTEPDRPVYVTPDTEGFTTTILSGNDSRISLPLGEPGTPSALCVELENLLTSGQDGARVKLERGNTTCSAHRGRPLDLAKMVVRKSSTSGPRLRARSEVRVMVTTTEKWTRVEPEDEADGCATPDTYGSELHEKEFNELKRWPTLSSRRSQQGELGKALGTTYDRLTAAETARVAGIMSGPKTRSTEEWDFERGRRRATFGIETEVSAFPRPGESGNRFSTTSAGRGHWWNRRAISLKPSKRIMADKRDE